MVQIGLSEIDGIRGFGLAIRMVREGKKKKVKTGLNLKESVGIEVEKIDNTVTKGSSMYRERPVYKLVGVVENELSLGGKGCLENKYFN